MFTCCKILFLQHYFLEDNRMGIGVVPGCSFVVEHFMPREGLGSSFQLRSSTRWVEWSVLKSSNKRRRFFFPYHTNKDDSE